MKNRVLLLVITIIAVAAMAVAMVGCSCKSEDSKNGTNVNPKNVPTAKTIRKGNGVVYVEDDFETISPTQKTTDKDGNTVISYTNSEGNKVTRTIRKDGYVRVVIRNKKGKVIKDKTFKEKYQPTTKASSKKKDSKKDDKKDDKEHAGVINNEDGWSDFY